MSGGGGGGVTGSGELCGAELGLGAPPSPRTPLRRLGSSRKLAAFASLRASLAEQARAVEARTEGVAGAAGELAEYCRRRAELEAEYSRALERLGRVGGSSGAAEACQRHARALASQHATLAALYGGALAARALRAGEHAARLARRARDLLQERQEELCGALLAAAATAKQHAAAVAQWRHHAAKLRDAHDRREAQRAADPTKLKKLRTLDKELEKRLHRHSEARARALRARHEHALALEEANAAMQRYYLDDVADIMLCAEVGSEAAICRVARTAAAAETALSQAAGTAATALSAAAGALPSAGPAARRRLLAEHRAFAPPPPMPMPDPQPEQDIEALVGSAAPLSDALLDEVRTELATKRMQYGALAGEARLHCQEAAKTLDAAEAELVRQLEGAEVDVTKLFGAGATGAEGAAPDDTPRRDQEDYYLAKVRAYMSCASRVSRLEGRAGAGAGAGGGSIPRRGARGLFAAPLRPDTLPPVLAGCVRVIATHGLTAQGVFRISGAHGEVAALRAALERGQQPLGRCGPQELHAVCTLLKLWLRSLRPPLLPPALHSRLLAARDASVPELKAALAALPTAHMVALRYLCAFLAHVAAHSARTRMDAWNLAICLGPTLLVARGAPTGQVAAQNALNHLLKRLIEQHQLLFPQDVYPHTLFVPPPPPPPDSDSTDVQDSPLPAAGGIHDDLSLYADDDEDAISEEDSVEWGGSCPPTPAEWGSEPPDTPEPSAPTAPITAPTAPTPRPPPPTPPPRCESRSSINSRSIGRSIADTLQALQLSGAGADEAAVGGGMEAVGNVPPLSSPEPPLTPSPCGGDLQLELQLDLELEPSMSREDAPDLVQGLPSLGPTAPTAPAAPQDSDPADAFAHNSDTLKKRPNANRMPPGVATEAPPVRPPTPL